MGKAKRIAVFVLRRATLYVTVKVLLTLVVLVFAASLVTTSTTYHAVIGGSVNVTNNLTAIDKGFVTAVSPSTATGTCPAANVTFTATPGTANTLILSGNYVYAVQVGTTAATQTNSCFTATLVLTPSGGNPTTYGPVSMATDSLVTLGQTIDCKFDIGISLPASPYSFKVTVQ